jgi:trans-aconitate methyltransferase
MNFLDKSRINNYHARKIEEWGVLDPRALGYSNDLSQQARFHVIANLFNFNKKCILDVGCGNGHLKTYLNKRYRDFTYIGIDQQAEFIVSAQKQYDGDKTCSFMEGDFFSIELPNADVVVASGVLSYRCEDSDYYKKCIIKLFNAAENALIFNMLDKSKMFPDEVIIGHDFSRIYELCKTLTTNVTVITGYLYFDFTLMLLKETKDIFIEAACPLDPMSAE